MEKTKTYTKHLDIINAFIDMGNTMSIKVDYIYNNYNLQINVYTDKEYKLEPFKQLAIDLEFCNYWSDCFNEEGDLIYFSFIFSITIIEGIKTMYHITDSENTNSILENGLMLSDSKNFPSKKYKQCVFFGNDVVDIVNKMQYVSKLKYTVFEVDLTGIELYVDGAFDEYKFWNNTFLSVLCKTPISKDRIVNYFDIDYVKSVENNKDEFLNCVKNEIENIEDFDFLHIKENEPKTLHFKNCNFFCVLNFIPFNNSFVIKYIYKRYYGTDKFDGIKIHF